MGSAKYGPLGIAALAVTATVALTAVPTPSPSVRLSADATALVLCGTTCPTPDAFVIASVANQFIAPTHPGQDIDYVPVTTPQELWPLTGAMRLLGLALGPPSLFGPNGPAWPDEPWWKLSGLFDRTANQSLQAGVADLEAAMAENGNDDLVIFGYSQGAGVANEAKRSLAEQYPAGTDAPDIDFVLLGDPNLPNGGLMARFPGGYIPILDFPFNGAAPTDTQFDTVEIAQQYDGFTDFPLYPLNLVADLNALLGMAYVHMYLLDNSLPADPKTSPAYRGTHGDTSYYLFENPDLPLFGPLRTLGVPEPVIDVVEPFFRVLVELGYDRSIPPWQPTPARLIAPINPVKLTKDLIRAVGEGIDNAAALVGLPRRSSVPAPAAPTTESKRTTSTAPRATRASTPKQAKSVGHPARPRPAARDSLSAAAATAAHASAPSPKAAASTGGPARRVARGDTP